MRLKHFIEGLQILYPYFDDGNGFHIGAEHDEFYVYKTNKPLSKTDIDKLYSLGWFQDETEDADKYDVNYGWMAFT